MYMWILGHTKPQNWFDAGVERGCISLNVLKIPFCDSYYIFWHFIFYIFVWKYKAAYQKQKEKRKKERKKKEKKSRPLFSNVLGRLEKGKQSSFCLGLNRNFSEICWDLLSLSDIMANIDSIIF